MTKNTTDRLPLFIYRLKTYFIFGQCEVSFSLRQLHKRLKLSFLTPNLVTCYRAEQNRAEQSRKASSIQDGVGGGVIRGKEVHGKGKKRKDPSSISRTCLMQYLQPVLFLSLRPAVAQGSVLSLTPFREFTERVWDWGTGMVERRRQNIKKRSLPYKNSACIILNKLGKVVFG